MPIHPNPGSIDMPDHPAPPPPVFETMEGFAQAARFGGPAAAVPRSHAMRRRVLVFFGVFLIVLLVGQSLNFMRSPIYRAQAKVQITPAGEAPATGDETATTPAPQGRQAFLLEAEMLGSRPLLEKAVPALQAQGLLAGVAPEAAVFAAQDMLSLTPQEGAPVVHLEAEGPDRVLVARLLNTVIEVYRDAQASQGETASAAQIADAGDELRVISEKVAEKRRSLGAYQLRSNIYSTVRDENQAVARLKGLSTSLAAATDREASAAGYLRTVEQAIAEGKPLPTSKDSLTVSGIELRLSQQREEWRALERQFTPQYLEMDPNARALKVRIANLEQQLEAERVQAQQAALANARAELASSRATVQRLQQQIAGDKQDVRTFNSQISAVQSLQDELAGLEKMQLAAQKKLLSLQASRTTRQPRLLVLEPAVTPQAPARPDYWRDAGIVLAAAVAMGFLAVWFVEFFNRAEPPAGQVPPLLVPQPWMVLPQPAGPPGAAGHARLAAAPDRPLLASPLPRELEPEEVARLLAAASPANQPVLSCLLCGLRPEEVAALRLEHVDLAGERLQVPGEPGRTVPLVASVRETGVRAAAAHAGATSAALFTVDNGARALSPEDIDAIVVASAHDAQLPQPQTVTPACLRHTYIAFLVRQGLRFSDLGQRVGRVGRDELHALSALAPDAPRVPLDAVESVLPPLARRHPESGA
jgi:succinoglycan biosynthesis transport protein ExoP